MKNFTSWCIFIIGYLALAGTACGQVQVAGMVQEGTGAPFPFATVLLLGAQDSAMVKGLLTSEQGAYTFADVKPGRYLIMASVVGFEKSYSPAFSLSGTSGTHQVRSLVLQQGNKQLQQVEVVAQKPLFEQQLDRLVVNVENSIVAAGATALEVLERSPGITLNRQSNTLAISGKDGVVVMINGKPSRVPMSTIVQLLGSMNAGNIEKIEIITTPPAQYDAEGNAGIINLVLKKNDNLGTSGAYSLTLGYGWYEKPGATLQVNHRTEKLNLYGDYSFMRTHNRNRVRTFRQSVVDGQVTQTSSLNRRQPVTTNHTARVGFDYTLKPTTTLSGMVSGFSDKWETGPVDETGDSKTTRNGLLQNSVHVLHKEENHWRHLMGNLHLDHLLTPAQEISLDMDYLVYHDDNPHRYTNAYTYSTGPPPRLNELDMVKETPIRLWVSKADYRNNFGEQTKLELGVKATLSGLENKVVVQDLVDASWQPNTEFSQHIQMEENIGAAYFNFNHLLPHQIKMQTGLRYEYTYTNLETITKEPLVVRRYGNLFPSVFLSRDLTKKSGLQVSYTRRITRPTYDNLAPFVSFIDPNTFLSGNTNLQAAITDALQASYRFRESYLVTVGYSFDKTPIVPWQVHLDPETNKLYARAENLKNARNYSVTVAIPVTVTPWWQLQSNLMGVWIKNLGFYDGREVLLQGGYGRLNLTQSFKLPQGFSAEVSGFYQTRSPYGISYSRAFGSVNAGLQHKFKKDKGTLRASIDDIFWTTLWRLKTSFPELQIYSYFEGVFSEPRILRLTYSRQFGNTKMKAATRRETSSEEERKRATGN